MTSTREARIEQLVAVCVKKQLTPLKTGFCDFILRATAAHYSCQKRTAKQYVDVLIRAYHYDQWRGNVQNNEYLTMEEKQEWIQQH